MTTSDLFIGPIYLLIIYMLAYRDRAKNYPKSHPLHTYYMRGLTLKLSGAVGAGLVYYFYYKTGDTIFYFWRTQEVIKEGQQYGFDNYLKLIFADSKNFDPLLAGLLDVLRAQDSAAYMVTRIASVVALFTFCNYTAIALVFAYISFKGIWALLRTLVELYPDLNREMAIACLFIPSVFFWGSGLFKDTITLTGVCWMFRSSYLIFFKRKNVVWNVIVFLIALYFTYVIKAYIALCFVPSLMFWIFFTFGANIKNTALRTLAMPFIIVFAMGFGYAFVKGAGGKDSTWSSDQIKDRAKDTQWWHTKVKELYGAEGGGGSFYSIGDGSFGLRNILISFPQAVVVSLFRPFLWEARNFVMLIASIEGMIMLYLTYTVVIKNGIGKVFKYSREYPLIFFCFFFSIFFAFAVGFTSFNFGALVRYKIPLMPFYLIGLYLVQYHVNKDKKLAELAKIEK